MSGGFYPMIAMYCCNDQQELFAAYIAMATESNGETNGIHKENGDEKSKSMA
jgi:hypothetical protein